MGKQNIQQVKLRFRLWSFSDWTGQLIRFASCPHRFICLITGESGVGKENFPQIIHQLQPTKTWALFRSMWINPEGTIDSELFGHEKAHVQELRHTKGI
jgi:DNA-binding NtrC family response regulator